MTSPANTKVAVSAATGFIGRHLVQRLTVDSGRRVVALLRPSSAVPSEWCQWGDRVEVVRVSDWSREGLDAALAGREVSAIYHLAAYGVRPIDRDVDESIAVNTVLPATMVKLAAERGAVLVISGSVAEYGTPAHRSPLVETSPLETQKLYGTTKAAGGLLATSLATHFGVRLRYLRLFNVYGPGEAPHRLLPSLVRKLRRRERVPMSAGSQVRDFVYVADAVAALVQAGDQVEAGEGPATAVWNVGTGVGHSVAEFARFVAQELRVDDRLLGFGDLPFRPDDVPWQLAACNQIAKDLGWQARHRLVDGIATAVYELCKKDDAAGMAAG